MLDHVILGVTNFQRSMAFYDRALQPLAIQRLHVIDDALAGYGMERPFFWLSRREAVLTGTHVAFAAPDRATVNCFHAAALKAGGRDNGAPGLRPRYHRDYYGGFVFDPDGHNIEAVCRLPETGAAA